MLFYNEITHDGACYNHAYDSGGDEHNHLFLSRDAEKRRGA